MNLSIRSVDIPMEGRKRLAAEAYRQSPQLRKMRLLACVLPVMFSSVPTDYFAPYGIPMLVHLGIRIACALALGAIIWETIGRRKLNAEVERLQNA